MKALAAIRAGKFRDETVPVETTLYVAKDGGKPVPREIVFDVDEGPRARPPTAGAGVPPAIMGIGPVEAVPKLLKRLRIKLTRIDLVELNEAFAAQSLPVIRELGLDADRLNVNGGAIALGHPLGCTGAKLTATLLHEMKRREGSVGLVTMCIGGGMGAAGLFERG